MHGLKKMMKIESFSCGAIIVLYNPRIDSLLDISRAIESKVEKLFLIDNTINPCFDIVNSVLNRYKGRFEYIPLYNNLGIAEAQNVGLTRIINEGYKFVLFLDQDSIPDDQMVEKLIKGYETLKANNINIGGVGPRPVRTQNNKKAKALIDKGRHITETITKVNQLMSSGTFSPVEVFIDCGFMESELFIDAVEFEWCWRVAKSGYSFFLVEDALLFHQLGSEEKLILGKPLHITTPFRKYYQYRNFIILFGRNYVPFYWKLSNAVKYAFKFIYYPIFIPPRFQYFKRMLQGIRAGIYYWINGKKI